MSVTLTHTSAPSLTLRLARSSNSATTAWGVSPISNDAACVPLSLGLRCLLYDVTGRQLTFDDLGRMGVSVHAAWDQAARQLLARHSSSAGVEFLVRRPPASPYSWRGCEVAGARQWMAHPSTFTVLYRHLHSLLEPSGELSFVLRIGEEVAVYDAAPEDVTAALTAGSVVADVAVYSLGFPVVR